ncbi:MAG: bifunctional 4-hydroxy-2-oxoglutarate aldolase/2-dehydro-3-deoxy-phosphogluconate aldolase, partial [Deltaproteobacteria bacterium]|nr:bifunctional 4-hydroxy-2-oxoglutarate aldolase/2-dehydro-3-deoxy-phosphogluconate aldolase [Deltaproteobacteria bacterium]
PGALGLVKELAQEEGFCVGAGTVLTKEEAEQAITNGARFVVSPTLELDLIPICREAGVTVVSGAATPTEILAAIRAQADMVKIFPADCLGGPPFVRQVTAPLPKTRFMVSGGVGRSNVKEYIQIGVIGLALGSAFLADLLAKQGRSGLVNGVRELVKLVEETIRQ